MAPQLIFGTATFGMDMTAFQDRDTVVLLLEELKTLGVTQLDTAARYPPFSPGRAEQLVGEAEAIAAGFSVDTKVYTDTKTDGSGDLGLTAIEKSVATSLERIRAPHGVCKCTGPTSDEKAPWLTSDIAEHPVRSPP